MDTLEGNARPPLLIELSIVDFFSNSETFDCFRGPLLWKIVRPETTLWANNLANKSGKKRANKSWQTLGKSFS